MKHRMLPLLRIVFGVLAVACCPLAALAQDEGPAYYDARLEGYPTNVTLDLSSTGLTWLLFVFLSIVCIGVMFKNARRTHLD